MKETAIFFNIWGGFLMFISFIIIGYTIMKHFKRGSNPTDMTLRLLTGAFILFSGLSRGWEIIIFDWKHINLPDTLVEGILKMISGHCGILTALQWPYISAKLRAVKSLSDVVDMVKDRENKEDELKKAIDRLDIINSPKPNND